MRYLILPDGMRMLIIKIRSKDVLGFVYINGKLEPYCYQGCVKFAGYIN